MTDTTSTDFYVTDENGKVFCAGKRFAAQDAAEAAALRSMKISTSRLLNNPHGTARSALPILYVMEAISGRHAERAIVTADGIKRKDA